MLAEVAVFDEEVAPDAAAEGLTADELAGIFEEGKEEIDGPRRERNDLAAPVQNAFFRIEMQRPDDDTRHDQNPFAEISRCYGGPVARRSTYFRVPDGGVDGGRVGPAR